MNNDSLALLLGGQAIGWLLLWASLRLRRKQRLLRDLPTSKTSGVFIGLVEVKGTAESEAPLTSFLSERSCVHYAWEVDEHWSRMVTETYTDDKGRTRTRTRQESGWTTVASGGESMPFYLRDETGVVRIDLRGAKFELAEMFEETVSRGHPLYYAKAPPAAVANSDHRRRFVETGIPLHHTLYVVGEARERADVVAPEIAANAGAELFLISTHHEERVHRSYAIWSWVCWTLGLIPALGGAWLAAEPGHAPISSSLLAQFLVTGLATYLLAWAAGWTWMVYNSVVNLRERTRQAWSLIDVQLKRRHDLIPQLAAIVDGLGTHEQSVQTTLAALRAQQTATPTGVAGPDYRGVAPTLRAIAEQYPALIAQESFAHLQRELVATEQRIALARSYYNDIATHYATRLEQIPDRWVARLGRFQPMPLLAAADFERAVVKVELAP